MLIVWASVIPEWPLDKVCVLLTNTEKPPRSLKSYEIFVNMLTGTHREDEVAFCVEKEVREGMRMFSLNY